MTSPRVIAITTIAVVSLLAGWAYSQSPVPVGKGSYADAVPDKLKKDLGKIESQELFLVKQDDHPLPSNKWWTQMLVNKFAKSLWVFPMKVETSTDGVDLFFPTRWASNGADPQSEFPLIVSGQAFKPADARAKDWSDWLLSFRLGESAEKYIDVTVVQGMPITWFEYTGVAPAIAFSHGKENLAPRFFALDGKDQPLPATVGSLGVELKSRNYGLFAPDGTKFDLVDGKLNVTFAGDKHYLAVAALPSGKHLAVFNKYAYAIPRDTKLSWQYDAAKGSVTTTWKITAEALKGTSTDVLQGWLPHHYRKTTNNLKFSDVDYLSPRGPMRCSAGKEFSISYAFDGIVPNLPGPRSIGGAHDYDASRMQWYLNELASKPKFGADTYWGGKDILRFGQCTIMAKQTGDARQQVFVDELKKAMVDWFTYTPGEAEHFFVHYPKWKALVGAKPSYGSEAFNDHHFHYGYFTFASALLAMNDRTFADDYGEMATLVAKEYANWDRSDKRFPFFRTFDIWAGHSWAGGTSAQGGNNQESSSEAVQSWAGLIYLGEALGNKNMTAAGVMGYAMETRATMEYWFNEGGDVFPPEWKHTVTGMVWSGGKVFGTYFTGDPAWIYGIQWLPASPMLSYLVRDPAAAKQRYENMQKDFDAHEGAEAKKGNRVAKPASIRTFGAALGNVMIGYVLMYDPDWAAAQMDELWNEKDDKIVHNASEFAVMYYQAHAMRSLGLVDWTIHGDSPTSMVYRKGDARTFLAWNPTAKPQTVTFYEAGKPIGAMTAAPQFLTSTQTLAAPAK
jgi:endoglucanase Acf2